MADPQRTQSDLTELQEPTERTHPSHSNRDATPIAGLPPTAWSRIFAHHFAAPISEHPTAQPSLRAHHTAPLRLCRDLYKPALAALYAHVRVPHSGINSLEYALRLPTSLEVSLDMWGLATDKSGDAQRKRASLVHTLEVWPTDHAHNLRTDLAKWRDARSAWQPRRPQHPHSPNIHHTRLRDRFKARARRTSAAGEPDAPTMPAVRAVSPKFLLPDNSPISPRLPPQPPSALHPKLAGLLRLVPSLTHLALHDVYVRDAASVRTLVSALAVLKSAPPRSAHIELRMWPSKITDSVHALTLPSSPDHAVVRHMLDELVPPHWTSSDGNAPDTERQRAWLKAVMSSQRLQPSFSDGHARAQNAMLREWLAGLHAATTTGLDTSARPPLPRVPLDYARLAELERPLRDTGAQHPMRDTVETFGPFPETQQRARDAYVAFTRDALERATDAADAHIQRLRDVVDACIAAPLPLAALLDPAQPDTSPGHPPSPDPLEELLALVAAATPAPTPADALRAIAAAFLSSEASNVSDAFPALRVIPIPVAFDPSYPIFVAAEVGAEAGTPTHSEAASPAIVLDTAPHPPNLPDLPEIPPPPATRIPWPDPLILAQPEPESLAPVRPLAWLACIPVLASSGPPLVLDGASGDGLAYILRERLVGVLEAWGSGESASGNESRSRSENNTGIVSVAGQGPMPADSDMGPLRPMTDPELPAVRDENLRKLFNATGLGRYTLDAQQLRRMREESERQAEEKRDEKGRCAHLSLVAADPLAAHVLCAADRTLWPRIPIAHISLSLPPAIPPLAALGDPDVCAHPAGRGLLHPSTGRFELRVSPDEWDDEMWLAGYLPPEVVRAPLNPGVRAWEPGVGWDWEGGAEEEADDETEGEDEDEMDVDSWPGSSESDYIDVDDDELAADFDGAPGETYDSAAAAAQAARMAARAKAAEAD